MIEQFRRGQIIPRRLRLVLANEKKMQHHITFGCDVEVSGKTIRATSEGCVVMIRPLCRKMSNGTFKKNGNLHMPQTLTILTFTPKVKGPFVFPLVHHLAGTPL